MRYDLAFLMCCCKSFLGTDEEQTTDGITNNYYGLLQIERDATAEEIKRAYKKQSLLMHPDKLAQRGLQITAADQARFTKMKEAYEVLSDPHKRETYDAIGSRGMKWMDEPFSIDPAELAHNFAKSSILDRSKIFAIFVTIAVAVLLQPILICMHVDGMFGEDASWLATLIPLWLWNVFLIFYHSRVIMMGPIPKPDHIPDSEWVDPLPMNKRIFSMCRFCLIVLFELLVALKLDNVVLRPSTPWFVAFIPLYLWEITTMYKKLPLARMRIVTVEDLESALGKPFSDFTPAEKELIGQRYSVVSSTSSPEFDAATKLKTRARHDILKSIFRIVFVIALLIQLDAHKDWNWYLVFLPFWVMTAVICYANYTSFAEIQRMAAEKDPTLFGTPTTTQQPANKSGTDVESGAKNNTNSNNVDKPSSYGAVGGDPTSTEAPGGTPPTATTTPNTSPPVVSPLTEEEREELKAQVLASNSRLCSKCCSQGFMLIIFLLFVAKLQGAGFSSFLIISPFLMIAGLILCCLGCAIFGVTEVSTDGIDFEQSDFAYTNAEQWTSANINSKCTQPQPQQTNSNNDYNPSYTSGSMTPGESGRPVYTPPTATTIPTSTTTANIFTSGTKQHQTKSNATTSASANSEVASGIIETQQQQSIRSTPVDSPLYSSTDINMGDRTDNSTRYKQMDNQDGSVLISGSLDLD